MRRLISIMLLAGAVYRVMAFTPNDPSKTVSTDGSYSDTTNAMAYVVAKAQDGWVMTVGSVGQTYVWSNLMQITVSNTFTMQGASPTVYTTISNVYTGGFGIGISTIAEKTVTIKDFSFPEYSAANALFLINGYGTNCFRLTNLQFNHSTGIALGWISDLNSHEGNGPYGVIDHCTNICSSSGYGWFVRENNSVPNGNAWTRDGMTFGTFGSVYVERCLFTSTNTFVAGRPAIDADNGARYTCRDCVFTNYNIGNHGADSPGVTNSCLQMEVYNNQFWWPPNAAVDYAIFNRGGSLIAWSNVFGVGSGGNFNSIVKQGFYRAATNNGLVTVDRFYPQDYLGTMQPGSGVDLTKTGQDPRYPSMHIVSEPDYFWGNTTHGTITFNFASSGLGGGAVGDGPFIATNRDWFIGLTRPSYSAAVDPHPLVQPTDPIITIQPQNQSVLVGNTATFTVTATTASPPLSYQWQMNGINIAGATQSTYSKVTQCSYNGSTFGVVVCNSTNSCVTSANATLTVTGCDGSGTVNAVHAYVGSMHGP